MDAQHKAIRALLSSMAPIRAEGGVPRDRILPEKEKAVLVFGVPCPKLPPTAAQLHVSVDGLAKIRRRAYAKLADEIRG